MARLAHFWTTILGLSMMSGGTAFPWGGLPRGVRVPPAVLRSRILVASQGGALQPASPSVSSAVLGTVLAAAVLSTAASELLELEGAQMTEQLAGASLQYEKVQRDVLPSTTSVDVADQTDYDRLLSPFLMPSELSPGFPQDGARGVSHPTFGVDFREEVFNPNFG